MEESLDILFVGYSLAVGGAEKKLIETAEYFKSQGKQVKILLIKNIIELSVPESIQNDLLIYDTGFSFDSLKKMRETIENYNPQIVFGFLGHVNVMLGMIKKHFPHIRFIGRENATYSVYFSEKNTILSFLIKKLYKKYLKKLDLVIFQSNYAREEGIRYFSLREKKTYVLNNPIPKVLAKKTKSNRNKKVRLLSVGRLEKVKNQIEMIEVLSILPNNYELIIVGNGPQLDVLKQFSEKLGVYNRVKFEGYQKDVSKFYLNCDLLLLTSFRETYPNVILEATAHGLYSVFYKMPGGIGDLVEEGLNGEGVVFGNLTEFASLIIRSSNKIAYVPKRLYDTEIYFERMRIILYENR